MSSPTETRFGSVFLQQYPTDLGISSVGAILSALIVVTTPAGSSIRFLTAIPLLLVLPGYAFIAVLFPAASQAAGLTGDPADDRPAGIDSIERLALSLPVSLTLIPLVIIGLALTDWGLSAMTVGTSLVAITVLCSQLAVVRRLRLPEAQRYTPRPRTVITRIRETEDGGTIATVSSVVLAVGVVIAVLALALGLVSPPASGGFTEFALYTQDDGELVAGDYPDEIEPGESAPVVVSIDNQEGTDMQYTIVIQEERFNDGEVVERTELQRLEAAVADGEQLSSERDIEPTVESETVRLSVLLYTDVVPSEPTPENADHNLYFWVTVGEDETPATE